MVFHDSRLVIYGSGLVYIQAERRWREVTRLEYPNRFSLDLYLGPTIPLGLAGRRPALA